MAQGAQGRPKRFGGNRPDRYGESMQVPISAPVWVIEDEAGRVVLSLWLESQQVAEAFAEGMMGGPAGAGLGRLRARKVARTA